MATKVVRIDIEVLADIEILKFVLKKKYPSTVIRELMDRLGYNTAFFEKLIALQNMSADDFRIPELEGDPPD